MSGGLDSVTLAYKLKHDGIPLHLVAINYGQRHAREIEAARTCAALLDVPIDVVDLGALGRHLTGSALTDSDVAVPYGHYAHESMRATVVPNRNAILLSVAYGIAMACGAAHVVTAVHAGDHPIYPDCRPAFITALYRAFRLGAEDSSNRPAPVLWAPFVHKTKEDIVRLGASLAVPFALTWSCYEGGWRHCGQCGTCVERKESFFDAGLPDPTGYNA